MQNNILTITNFQKDIDFISNTIIELGVKIIPVLSNIKTALAALKNENYSLVILDLAFDEHDGISILKMINTLQTPVVIFTDISEQPVKNNALKFGVLDYIIKPIDKAEFLYRIKNILQRNIYVKTIQQYNAKLESEVEYKTRQVFDTHLALIYELAALLEMREPNSSKHLKNISYFTQLLTEELSYSQKFKNLINKEYIEAIQLASALHDIGKIAVRDAILLKPGALTAEEFEFIKLHTIIGGQIIDECKKYISNNLMLELAAEIAYYHHERWDGTGYNANLKAEQIPLSARIVAVADVYDTMTSERIYKSKMPHKEAFDYIASQRCKHFCPDVTEAFIKVSNKFSDYKLREK